MANVEISEYQQAEDLEQTSSQLLPPSWFFYSFSLPEVPQCPLVEMQQRQQAEVPISHLTLDQESSYDSQTSHSLEEPSNFSGKYFQLPLVNLPILSTTNSTQPNHTSLPAPKIIIHSGKHNKEKRTDNACNYKQRFSKLIRKNYGASVNWAHYKNTRICGSLRPCIRVHMSFCTLQGGEFLNLRREFESKSYNRLGNRNCKCSLLRNQHVSPSM